MRVLMLHNYYLERGGEDVSFKMEADLLRKIGVEVRTYEQHNERVATLGPGRTAVRSLWSRESYSELRAELRKARCDVVHVQNFFPLISPAAYYAARAEGAAVVQTLRNFRLLCPAGSFYRDGQVCESCFGKSFAWPGVRHACYRGSAAASGAVAVMSAFHRALGTWKNKVDIFISPSHFLRDKFEAAGFPTSKIVVKPNFVYPDPEVGPGTGGFALFAGRLADYKGLDTVLAAWARLQERIPLKILGTGPLEDRVRAAAREMAGVEFLGWRSLQETYDIMGKARFLLFPSEWYESFGRVAAEAYAKGTPVVASRLGAMSELIDDGKTGLLFRPGDPDDLVEKVTWLIDDSARLTEMRRHARARFEKDYSESVNAEVLMRIYDEAIARRRSGAKS